MIQKTYIELKKKILKAVPDIFIKEYNDLVIIANKYKDSVIKLSPLENECKNIIIDKTNMNIVVYTYNNIYYNDDAKSFIINNDITKYKSELYESYEGTNLIVFNHNDKWYISTRKCLNSDNSIWISKSFYKLFLEVINDTFENFCNLLDKNKYYIFILVHYENKNIIDYSYKFGKEYKKVVYILTKDKKTHGEIDNDMNLDKKYKNIIYQEKLDNFNLLDTENKKNNFKLPINTEGIIQKLTDKENNKTYLLKYQTNAYNIINKIKPNYNCKIKIMIDLYKNELLNEHIIYFPENKYMILNDINNDDTKYITIGIIDAVFKTLTSELFELFKLLYNLKNCSQKNSNLYNTLPVEYKTILYKIRGIYFNKKQLYINDTGNKDYKKYNLKIMDIYMLLKNYDINYFINILKSRDILFNNSDFDFSIISIKCEKYSIELLNILIKNLKLKI